MIWFVRKVHILKADRHTRKPIGLKVWSLASIIILSIIPIINVFVDIAIVGWILIPYWLDEVEWDEMFPPKPGVPPSKLMKMLNKDLFR